MPSLALLLISIPAFNASDLNDRLTVMVTSGWKSHLAKYSNVSGVVTRQMRAGVSLPKESGGAIRRQSYSIAVKDGFAKQERTDVENPARKGRQAYVVGPMHHFRVAITQFGTPNLGNLAEPTEANTIVREIDGFARPFAAMGTTLSPPPVKLDQILKQDGFVVTDILEEPERVVAKFRNEDKSLDAVEGSFVLSRSRGYLIEAFDAKTKDGKMVRERLEFGPIPGSEESLPKKYTWTFIYDNGTKFDEEQVEWKTIEFGKARDADFTLEYYGLTGGAKNSRSGWLNRGTVFWVGVALVMGIVGWFLTRQARK